MKLTKKIEKTNNLPLSDEINPTEGITSTWLHAFRQTGRYKTSKSGNGGKWLVFITKENIDTVWRKIKEATENGFLGDYSKVSAGKENPFNEDKNKFVICVYTYDSTDVEDVKQIRARLRTLGITFKIRYKTDKATRENKYSANGDKNISLFFE
jgi:hypothetical protein